MLTESAYTSLERVSQIKDKQERRDAFRALLEKRPAITLVVQYAFHPDVVFDLPEGGKDAFNYTKAKHDDYSVFYTNAKKLRNYCTISPVSRAQKTQLWLQLLSNLAGGDDELLLAMKQKKMPWKTLNKSFTMRAVPELFPPLNDAEALALEKEDA